LGSIGARSINNIVDATNFVMFDIGQPLHAFDADKVRGGIVVRKATAGEKIVILDGREVELRSSDLVIADSEGPLAIAGVKGGKRAEVTAATKNIIIESANFDPASVRRTSTRANLRNDSSKRFENEITPELCGEAIDCVAALIVEIAGGKAGAVTDVYPNPVKPWTVSISAKELSATIGAPVSADEAKDILERQGCAVSLSGETLSVTPPFDRLDLRTPEDLVDEVARIRGYDGLPSVVTPQIPPTPIDKGSFYAEKAKNILVGLGFSEVQTYTLVQKGTFEISYPLASDKSALREKIAPKLSEALAQNARNAELLGLEAVKIFEIGAVFPKEGERVHIALGAQPVKKRKGVTAESLVGEALDALGIEAQVANGVAEADFAGYVDRQQDPRRLSDLGISPIPAGLSYKPFSPYPFISRDIAFFAPSNVNAEAARSVIASALASAAGELLVKGPDLFDRFEKEGKVSYGFRAIFQSFTRTLSDDEANAAMAKVYDAVKTKGWEAR
jgi:phenylalanyl-tRNA synthetase beta chain